MKGGEILAVTVVAVLVILVIDELHLSADLTEFLKAIRSIWK